VPTPRRVNEDRLAGDPAYRMDHLRGFMGFDERDWRHIQRTEPILREQLRKLVERLYEDFMRFEPTARFYHDETGDFDRERYEHRVEGFVLWFERIFDWEKNERYFDYLRDVGRIHTARRGFSDMHVNRFYMLPTFGILLKELGERLGEGLEDPEDAARATAAWGRFFLLQLDLMESAYREDDPQEGD